MSYDVYEYSVQDGDPIFKMQFVQGLDEFLYTTAPYIIADSNGTWNPVPFDPSEITQSQELNKDGLKIRMPRDNALASTFLGSVPEVITSVTIFRSHAGDTSGEYQIYWKGRVSGVELDSDTVTLNCENIFTSMRRPGLRAIYQRGCRHPLYGNGCNLNDYDFAVTVTCASADASTIVCEDLITSDTPDGYYAGGTLETAEGYKRFIIAQSFNILTLIRPLTSLNTAIADSGTTGVQVTLYPGCDHTTDHCLNRFANLDNYGGFPWIPNKNPFANQITGSIV